MTGGGAVRTASLCYGSDMAISRYGAVAERRVKGQQAEGRIVLPRTLVLVGLMGAGKSAVGKRLAIRLGVPFHDADQAIEQAAGCTIEEIFQRYGEPAFRDVERRVIARLLHEDVHVLSTGGGAFIDAETRAHVRARGLSMWLRASLDVLVARTARRGNRPLLKQGDPHAVLERLMAVRYPIYAEADMMVESRDAPVEDTVDRALATMREYLERHAPQPAPALELQGATRTSDA
jgi:shikimate kinase